MAVHHPGEQPEGAAQQHHQLQRDHRGPADRRHGDLHPHVRHGRGRAPRHADLPLLPAVLHEGHYDWSR